MAGVMLEGFILCWETNRDSRDHLVRHALVLSSSHGLCWEDAQCKDRTDGKFGDVF